MIDLDHRQHIEPYQRLGYVHSEDGYIVWRTGTGGNAELLHLRSQRPGGGQRLLVRMLEALTADPPYATVFGFTRAGNTEAQEFYRKAGFTLTRVTGVYADGEAIVFSRPYAELLALHRVEEEDDA